MLTECPSCLTVFRVTSAILKMGHGQVRCGKCRKQFDALESLLDDDSSADVATEANEQTVQANTPVEQQPQESTIESYEADVGEEITLEGSRIEISGTYRVLTDDSSTHSEAEPGHIVHEHVVIDRDEPRVGDANSLADEPYEEQIVEINADDGEPVAEAAHHLLADARSTAAYEDPVPFSQRIWKRARQHQDTHRNAATQQIVAELNALTQKRQPLPARAGWWTTASVVLAVLLIAQAVHHYRDPLVRSPKWGGTVAGVYRALGLPLTPNWDLHAYELQQWGVLSEASAHDALRVRASITNTAPFAQPYPLVKLALEDRWGATVAMREFAPEEYLQSTATANRMLAPRQRANAEIVIVDPGTDAVGFQIHACLAQGKRIVCADELPVGPYQGGP